jgi:hypothetical protein
MTRNITCSSGRFSDTVASTHACNKGSFEFKNTQWPIALIFAPKLQLPATRPAKRT